MPLCLCLCYAVGSFASFCSGAGEFHYFGKKATFKSAFFKQTRLHGRSRFFF